MGKQPSPDLMNYDRDRRGDAIVQLDIVIPARFTDDDTAYVARSVERYARSLFAECAARVKIVRQVRR